MKEHELYILLAVVSALLVGFWLGTWTGEHNAIRHVCKDPYIAAIHDDVCP